jgi:demethoxyubiquinone hydroxylase (CLK1/Coq7/Cat5 family)
MKPDELELAALCGLAWEQRGTDSLREAVEEIVTWHYRRHIRRFECKQRELAALVLVLRDSRKVA